MAGAARQANTVYRRALGQRVRDLRLGLGVSQESLAHQTGIARSYMGGIERGERNPSVDHLVKIAVGLGVQPSHLLPDLPV